MFKFGKVRALRFFVFQLWFVSLLVIVVSFMYNYCTSELPINSSELIKSASIILGVVTPTLGAMLIFYYNMSPNSESIIENKSTEFVVAAILSSTLYHVIFCSLIVSGIAFNALIVDIQPERMYRNCVFIVNSVGLLSVLLGPGAWLFATGSEEER